MVWPTFAACLEVSPGCGPPWSTITGGAPELKPAFPPFVQEVRALGIGEVIDRCNLSVLLLDSQRDLAEFLAAERVHIVASLRR